MKKLMLSVAALAVVATPIAASAEPWGHDRGGDYRAERFDRGDGGGGALAAGIFGLVLGAAIASDHPYAYEPACYWQTRPIVGRYGYVRYERVEVCR
ncbi:MAG TPA: hypothetical protein VMU93_03270 [Caulobacteraceae bacterium]|nr:hypothetical protein [Caulobacteraceae bacterium]